MNSRTYKKDAVSGIISLYDGPVQMICPFRPPMPVPSRIQGQMSFADCACMSNCPHFAATENKDKSINVSLSCGSYVAATFERKPDDQDDDQGGGNIISIN